MRTSAVLCSLIFSSLLSRGQNLNNHELLHVLSYFLTRSAPDVNCGRSRTVAS